MLHRRPRPSPSERFRSAVAGSVHPLHSTFLLPRDVVVLVLVAAAGVWAMARGVHYYGLTPTGLADDLDQPPWLLLLVGAWLWYRSRRR